MTASLRQWEYVMGVNFFGVGHTLRHFVPKMMDQEAPGAIVTTASLTGSPRKPCDQLTRIRSHSTSG